MGVDGWGTIVVVDLDAVLHFYVNRKRRLEGFFKSAFPRMIHIHRGIINGLVWRRPGRGRDGGKLLYNKSKFAPNTMTL